jgi:hypothetical protein
MLEDIPVKTLNKAICNFLLSGRVKIEVKGFRYCLVSCRRFLSRRWRRLFSGGILNLVVVPEMPFSILDSHRYDTARRGI